MNNIDNNVLANIFSYGDTKDLNVSRRVNTSLKDVIDTHDIYNIRVSGKRRLLKNGSIGLTGSIYKDHVQENCIKCNISCRKLHPVYKVYVCKSCTEMYPFSIRGVNMMCRKYFITPDDLDTSDIIFPIKMGKIMEHDAEKAAIRKHGYKGLAKLIESRVQRSILLHKSRVDAKNNRFNSLKKVFSICFKNTNLEFGFGFLWEKLLIIDNGRYNILDDFTHLKISTRKTVSDVFHLMKNLLEVFHLIKENHLIEPSGDLTSYMKDYTNIGYMLKRYMEDKDRFSSTCRQYFLAQRSFNCRKEYDEDECPMRILEEICDSEGIDCNDDRFHEYLYNGIGDPFSIARSIRKFNFLLDNGFNELYNGCKISTSRMILDNTFGYDPML